MLSKRILRAVVAVGLVASACSCDPEETTSERLRIVSPLNGATITLADDIAPDIEGVQIEVVVLAQRLDGQEVRLETNAGTAAPRPIASGQARLLLTVTGAGTIRANVTDVEGAKLRSGAIGIAFDDSPRVCRIASPVDGATLVESDDASASSGFQHAVQVRCAGVELGTTVELEVNGGTVGQAPLGVGGLALWSDVEFLEGENELVARTKTNDDEELRAQASVTVQTGRCRVELAPPTGTRFNARGEGGATADLVPGAPMDAVFVVSSSCERGTVVLRQGTTPLADAPVAPRVQLPLQLPDGPAALRAVVLEDGKELGVSALARYEVDAVVPLAQVLFPLDDAHFTDASDRSEEEGLQISVRGGFEGIDPGTPFEVVLATNEEVVDTIDGVVGSDGSFDLLVTLPDGRHELFVRASRPSGTTATSDTVRFSSRYQDAAFLITSPADGGGLTAAHDEAPDADGFQFTVSLAGRNLGGASGTLNCGGAETAFTLDADGQADVLASVDVEGCSGRSVRCVARLVSDGTEFETPPVTLLIDAEPPVVTLLAPQDGTTLGTAVVNVVATTSCAAEEQTVVVLLGEDVVHGPVAIENNAFTAGPVLLPSGLSSLTLRVSDKAGNVDERTLHLAVDADVPVPVFLAPEPDALVTLGAADDADADLVNGFQHEVVVGVENEAPGTLVELDVGGRAPLVALTQVDAEGRRAAVFPAVTFPEGSFTLVACATDEGGSTGCVSQNVLVDTGRPICTVVTPGDGKTLGLRDDVDPASDGVQAPIVVRTSNADATFVTVRLRTPAGTETTMSAGVEAGEARLPDVTFDEEGDYVVSASCANEIGFMGHALPNHVRVAFAAPDVDIVEPENGAVFNLQSPDRGVEPGFQLDVRVRAMKPAQGAVAYLTTNCGENDVQAAPVQFNSRDEATFHAVSVPDVARCRFTVVLEDAAGNRSAPRTSEVEIDREPPIVSIARPADGAVYGALHDADPSTPEFELQRVEAQVEGADLSTAKLSVGTIGFAGGVVSGTNTKEWSNVPLLEGLNDLVVRATDAAGNVGSATVGVTVATRAPVVRITNLANNAELRGKNDVDPSTPGLQYNFQVGGERLGPGTKIRICSQQAPAGANDCLLGGGRELGSIVLTGSGAVVPKVTIPQGRVELYAEAEDLAENVSTSGPLSIYVDSNAPIAQELVLMKHDGTVLVAPGQASRVLGPLDDSDPVRPGFQARVRIKVTDGIAPVAGVFARLLDTNPLPNTQIGPGQFVDASDGTATFDVTLTDGGHRIHVFALDRLGNGSSDAGGALLLNFGVDTTPPAVSIIEPLPGVLLAADDADPSTPGLQYDVRVVSDAGIGRAVQLLVDGQSVGEGVLGSDGASIRVTIPEGSHVLVAQASDAAGNTGRSSPVAIQVDSVPPVVSITAPAEGAVISTDADPSVEGFQISVSVAYSQVEAGQTLELRSSRGGVLASASTTSAGIAVFPPVTVSSGAQTLTARVSDVAGNTTTSSPVSITADTDGPAVWFAAMENPLWFGRSTDTGDGRCHVRIEARTSVASVAVALLEGGVVRQSTTSSGGEVSFNNVIIEPGKAAELQLRATDSEAREGYSATRIARCKLESPAVAFTQPNIPEVKYVAYGNPGNVAGAIADLLPTPELEADFKLSVTGAVGARLEIVSSIDGVLASRRLQSDGEKTFDAVRFRSQGRHTLVARVTDVAGNASEATLVANVDVLLPGMATPQASVLDRRNGKVRLVFPTPGSDGTTGGRVAGYRVRVSSAAVVDEANWQSATSATTDPVVVAAPGTPQQIDVTGLGLERQYFFAVRAVDEAGNLGPLGTSPRVDLALKREAVELWSASDAPSAPVLSHLVVMDLDGDGYDDVIASHSSRNGNKGEVSILYGGSSLATPVVVASRTVARFGSALAVGDVNGDGILDLLVGAQHETTGLSSPSAKDGAVHVFLGRANTRLTSDATADAVIQGRVDANQVFGFGFSVAVVSDLTGDGIDDIVIGSPGERTSKGRVYVVAGRGSWPATLVAHEDAHAILSSPFAESGARDTRWLGHQIVSLGDVNGDGYGDFAVSVPGGEAAVNGTRPVFLVSGALAAGSVVVSDIAHAVYPDAATTPYDPTNPKLNQFGAGLATGNLAGDGGRDLAVLDGTLNRFFIYRGSELSVPSVAGNPPVDVSSSRLIKSEFQVASGTGTPTLSVWRDINGDGVDELATAFTGVNKTWGYYGRSAVDWRALMAQPGVVRANESVVFERAPTDGVADFGIRSAAGHIATKDGRRDVAVLSLGGKLQILRDP